MTEQIHTCNYECQKPECIKSQRDELFKRLEQPDQEPAAHVSSWKDEKGYVMQGYNREISTSLMSGTALYLAPQKTEWVCLTEEAIYAIGKHLGQACRLGGNPDIDIDYARAIEDKIKELNT